VTVMAPEELQFPTFAGPRPQKTSSPEDALEPHDPASVVNDSTAARQTNNDRAMAQPGHIVIPENTKGGAIAVCSPNT
jgi:hypothetical protein